MAAVKCAHCSMDIDVNNDKYYQAVPKVGDLCIPCHRHWMHGPGQPQPKGTPKVQA